MSQLLKTGHNILYIRKTYKCADIYRYKYQVSLVSRDIQYNNLYSTYIDIQYTSIYVQYIDIQHTNLNSTQIFSILTLIIHRYSVYQHIQYIGIQYTNLYSAFIFSILSNVVYIYIYSTYSPIWFIVFSIVTYTVYRCSVY